MLERGIVQQKCGHRNITPLLWLKTPASTIMSVVAVRNWMSRCVDMTIVTLVLDAVIVDMSTVMTMVTEDVRGWGCKFVFNIVIFVDDKDQILSGAFRV